MRPSHLLSDRSHHPMRSQRGFTLIELLIVVVIIGILAAIAIPKFAATKGKAYYAAMKSDLHNLTTAEESFFYDHTRYSARLDSVGFTGSHGDSLTVLEARPWVGRQRPRIPSRILISARCSSERRRPSLLPLLPAW